MDYKEKALEMCLAKRPMHDRKIAPVEKPCPSCRWYEKALTEAHAAGVREVEFKLSAKLEEAREALDKILEKASGAANFGEETKIILFICETANEALASESEKPAPDDAGRMDDARCEVIAAAIAYFNAKCPAGSDVTLSELRGAIKKFLALDGGAGEGKS